MPDTNNEPSGAKIPRPHVTKLLMTLTTVAGQKVTATEVSPYIHIWTQDANIWHRWVPGGERSESKSGGGGRGKCLQSFLWIYFETKSKNPNSRITYCQMPAINQRAAEAHRGETRRQASNKQRWGKRGVRVGGRHVRGAAARERERAQSAERADCRWSSR